MDNIFEIRKSIAKREQIIAQTIDERDKLNKQIKELEDELLEFTNDHLDTEDDWRDVADLPEDLLKIVDEYLQPKWPVLFRVNYKKYKDMSLGEIYNILNKDKNLLFRLTPHESATLLKNCKEYRVFGTGSVTAYNGFLTLIHKNRYQYRIIESGYAGTDPNVKLRLFD